MWCEEAEVTHTPKKQYHVAEIGGTAACAVPSSPPPASQPCGLAPSWEGMSEELPRCPASRLSHPRGPASLLTPASPWSAAAKLRGVRACFAGATKTTPLMALLALPCCPLTSPYCPYPCNSPTLPETGSRGLEPPAFGHQGHCHCPLTSCCPEQAALRCPQFPESTLPAPQTPGMAAPRRTPALRFLGLLDD